MIKSEGKIRIDAVKVVELSLGTILSSPGAGVQVKFVLMNSVTGDRFGSGTFNTWSEETTAKLNEAIQSMEKDICSAVFEEGVTTNSVQPETGTLEDEVPGL